MNNTEKGKKEKGKPPPRRSTSAGARKTRSTRSGVQSRPSAHVTAEAAAANATVAATARADGKGNRPGRGGAKPPPSSTWESVYSLSIEGSGPTRRDDNELGCRKPGKGL